MGASITNRLITRGMGATRGLAGRAGMITSGFGGLLLKVLSSVLSSDSRWLAWARLKLVGGVEPQGLVVGTKVVKVSGEIIGGPTIATCDHPTATLPSKVVKVTQSNVGNVGWNGAKSIIRRRFRWK